ncbi:hypothetical protein RD792_004304 [Penstemon davidsonii]|uniref:Mitochondrial import inner membrane translocase subunit Tim21 n=1 Tax=Penstemon davidsonii TaxID=160366 RepID=A0ABR0DH07_9LAMI|nr:hypothetical protein RD792_004304 [Penstemon davidsonii]
MPSKSVSDVGFSEFSSLATERSILSDFTKGVLMKSACGRESIDVSRTTKVARQLGGSSFLGDRWTKKRHALTYHSPFQPATRSGESLRSLYISRSFASQTTKSSGEKGSETRKEVSTVEDPFAAPTYNIPEKPVTFTEGASYSLIILAGLGVAAAAAYGVFKELIFQPKEYKIFNKALDRIQNDSQVRVRIGHPITGYGSESRNRAARQRVPHKTWTDEDGVEHILVNFHIRGPHGAGKVFTEMFKDSVDKQWKFMYLIVEIESPSPAQLMLESYVPA